jgi:hydroxypyruvate isomerase
MRIEKEHIPQRGRRLSRREMFTGMAGAAAMALVPGSRSAHAAEEKEQQPVARRGRINQSVAHWCFEPHWSMGQFCQIAKRLGCKSIELVPPENWPMLKEYGLTCAILSSHSFVRGTNNPLHWNECLGQLEKAIDDASDGGFGSVITFTGYGDTSGEEGGSRVDPEQGARNCVAAYKKVIGRAEKKKVNLCLEQLNTRDDTHPMKGHPGYQGDHVDYCMDIIKKVGSPNMKLLFDVYHVQVMDGDLIRRIRQCGEYIGHVHVAGNPGRAELDDNQEINFPAVMRALVEIGYKGYVGHEFIPTRDPLEGLTQAVALCDV